MKSGISRGSFCRSASRVTMNLPRVAFIPAHIAADCPQLKAKRKPRTHGSAVASSFRTFQELSLLKSSVMTISYESLSGSTASRIAVTRGRKLSSSLWQGITKLRTGSSVAIDLNAEAEGNQSTGKRPETFDSDQSGRAHRLFPDRQLHG